jgi:hypothetical protein
MSIKAVLKKLFKPLITPEPILRFKCIEGGYYVGTPVVEARRVIPEFLKKQIKTDREAKFARCPGMFDLAQAGYLVTAPMDIHIKANKQGVSIKVENCPQLMAPTKMEYALVEGMINFKDTVKPQVWKIPMPWAVYAKKGYSAQVLDARMHFPHTDKMFIYPGVVDYEDFHSINLIFSITEECEFTIWAGTPILQVIPFKRESFTAVCGKATERELDKSRFGFYSRQANFYRKMFHSKKQYKIEQV